MEPQTNAPLGQPITPNPTNPQYVPQPLQDPPPKPYKRLLLIILAAVGLLVLLAGAIWWLGQGAKKDYARAATAYQKDIKTVRDAMNEELNSKDVGASSAEAKPIFEATSKKLQTITSQAPKAPKVFGFIPVGSEDAQVTSLTKTTNEYATALRYDFVIFSYYKEVTGAFKPIKDLGTITFFSRNKVMSFAEEWPKFNTFLKTVKPPKKLQVMHADLLKQTAELETKIVALGKSFDTNSDGTNDRLLGELSPLTTKFNKTFSDAVLGEVNKSFDTVNSTYDKLDEQLKR